MRMVLGEALALVGSGVVAGALGAWLLTRMLRTLLFGVKPTDPATFVAVAALLTAVAAIAASIPGLRATRVDPVVALRSE
jgi:ABC-type antimicrobial peptide transport system permease subunit